VRVTHINKMTTKAHFENEHISPTTKSFRKVSIPSNQMRENKNKCEHRLNSEGKFSEKHCLTKVSPITKNNQSMILQKHAKAKENLLDDNECISSNTKTNIQNVANDSQNQLTEGERAYWQQRMPRGFQFYLDRLAKAAIRAQPRDAMGFLLWYSEHCLVARDAQRCRLPELSYLARLCQRRGLHGTSIGSPLKIADSLVHTCPIGNEEMFPDVVPQEFPFLSEGRLPSSGQTQLTRNIPSDEFIHNKDDIQQQNMLTSVNDDVIENGLATVSASLNSSFTLCPSHKEFEDVDINPLEINRMNVTETNNVVEPEKSLSVVYEDMNCSSNDKTKEKPSKNPKIDKLAQGVCMKANGPCLLGLNGIYEKHEFVDEEKGSSVDPPIIHEKHSLSYFVDNIIQNADMCIEKCPKDKTPQSKCGDGKKLSVTIRDFDSEKPLTHTESNISTRGRLSLHERDIINTHNCLTNEETDVDYICKCVHSNSTANINSDSKSTANISLDTSSTADKTSDCTRGKCVKDSSITYPSIINKKKAAVNETPTHNPIVRDDSMRESIEHLRAFTDDEMLWSLMPEYYITTENNKTFPADSMSEDLKGNHAKWTYNSANNWLSLKPREHFPNHWVNKIPPVQANVTKFDSYIVTESSYCKGNMHNTRYFPEDSRLQESLHDLASFIDSESLWESSAYYCSMSNNKAPLKIDRNAHNEHITVHKLVSDIIQKAFVVAQDKKNII